MPFQCTIIITMSKIYNQIRIQTISIEVDEEFSAQEFSKLKFRVFSDQDAGSPHATKFYGANKGKRTQWTEALEFKYTEQDKLNFQILSEHNSEHQQTQGSVLYTGIYYLDKQTFSRCNTTHIYDLEGEKKGLLKWEIKIVTKVEQQMQQHIAKKEIPLVRQDLIGLISLHYAYFEISSPLFNHKKHPQELCLRIKFEGKEQEYQCSSAFKWKLGGFKLQYIISGSRIIQFYLLQKGKIILEGKTDCQRMQEYKRFINHSVNFCNKYGIKVGNLVLQYRYIAKQQLLDLIYSPTNKLNYNSQRCQSSGVITANKPIKMKQNESSSIFKLPYSKLTAQSRYKVSPFHSKIKKSKAMLFSSSVAMNPSISQMDPQKNTDFAAKHEKGPSTIRRSQLSFNHQSKANPDVDSCKLPSIWSKY